MSVSLTLTTVTTPYKELKALRIGIICSSLLHIAAALIFIFGLPHMADRESPEPDVIPVDIVNIADLTVNENPKEEVQKPAPEPQPSTAAAATPPEQEAEAVPLPDVKAEVEKKPELKKPKPRTPKATLMLKPTPPSRFDANRLALLIDKKLEKNTAASKQQVTPEKPSENRQPVRSNLDRAQLSASLAGAIQAQIQPCWSIPAGAKEAEDLKVRIRIYLLPDGNLARPPEIVDRLRMNMPGQSFYRVAAESARRAVQRCAPLKLPPESYDIWNDIELNFDPGEMLGG
jgi:outer membrane biosynthesis protein TonB